MTGGLSPAHLAAAASLISSVFMSARAARRSKLRAWRSANKPKWASQLDSCQYDSPLAYCRIIRRSLHNIILGERLEWPSDPVGLVFAAYTSRLLDERGARERERESDHYIIKC